MRRVLSIAGMLIASSASAVFGGESALRFSGAQALSVPPLVPGRHTVEAWIRPDDPVPVIQTGTIFDWSGRVVLRLSSAGLVYLVDLGGASPARISAPSLPAGQWHHVAASFDGIQMRLVVDGKLAMVKLVAGQIAGGSAAAAWGAPLVAGTNIIPFAGLLDELRIWNRSRTVEEIEEMMNDHLGSGVEDLVAYWDLDEGKGQTAADSAGGHDAVLGDSMSPESRDPQWSSAIAPIRRPDPGFFLGFEPAGPIPMMCGEPFEVGLTLALSPLATSGGVTAWTISVRHDRSHFLLDQVLLDGTEADRRGADGFTKVEILDDGLNSGFLSQVVLSAAGGISLPAPGTWKIARARYLGVLDYDESFGAVIRFDDRLKPGGIVSQRNAVTADGAERRPAEGRLVVDLEPPDFSLDFEPAEARALPGQEIVAVATLTTSQNRADTGVDAWSIAVTHDPGVLDLVDVTTSGTVIDQFPSDQILRLVEKVSNESGTGFISMVILNISGEHSLPRNGRAELIKARYRVREGAQIGSSTTVAFTDGLKGAGDPVENQIIFIGGIRRPSKAALSLEVAPPIFIRGDGNGDGAVNISDVIYLLEVAFHGKIPSCADANDMNDDGRINVADALYLVLNFYKGGSDPRPPYPTPGEDPSSDRLGCTKYP